MRYQKEHAEIIGAISYGVADAMMLARAPRETVARIGIEELNLSVRTSNCLRAEGVFFVDLLKLTRSQVVRIPGLASDRGRGIQRAGIARPDLGSDSMTHNHKEAFCLMQYHWPCRHTNDLEQP
jgi:DNA-directed RNA polymerase alpha subunit